MEPLVVFTHAHSLEAICRHNVKHMQIYISSVIMFHKFIIMSNFIFNFHSSRFKQGNKVTIIIIIILFML